MNIKYFLSIYFFIVHFSLMAQINRDKLLNLDTLGMVYLDDTIFIETPETYEVIQMCLKDPVSFIRLLEDSTEINVKDISILFRQKITIEQLSFAFLHIAFDIRYSDILPMEYGQDCFIFGYEYISYCGLYEASNKLQGRQVTLQKIEKIIDDKLKHQKRKIMLLGLEKSQKIKNLLFRKK